jgi:hypothetical protein
LTVTLTPSLADGEKKLNMTILGGPLLVMSGIWVAGSVAKPKEENSTATSAASGCHFRASARTTGIHSAGVFGAA